MLLAAALTAAQWLAAGVAHAQRGDYLSAEPAFAEACRLETAMPDACYYLGRARYFLDRFEDALTALRQSQASDSRQPPGRALTAIAQALEGLGRAEEAEAGFRQALEAAPRSAESHTKYGLFLVRQGRAAAAVGSLEKAAQLDPTAREAPLELGRALYQLGRLEQALPHLRRAAKLDPKSAPAHTILSKIYRRLGREAEADRHLAILRSFPTP